MDMFDPVTIEILWRRLLSIVDEADAVISRTAFTSFIRETHDYTCIVTDRYGRELAQGTFATPGQTGAMALGVKQLVKQIPAYVYQPGDVYITNDPWALAGHLNDICAIRPIFFNEQLTGFTACVFHHADVGGRVSSDNQDIYEDGLFIPLVKIYAGGELNEPIMDMIRWNVRNPDEITGDIRAQIAATRVCDEQVRQLLADSLLDGLDELADEIIDRTEASLRAAIAKVPDGVYCSEGVIEQIEGEADVVIKAAVEVNGDDITIDLEGSSPQVSWGGNVVYNFTYSYAHMAIKSMFDPELPNNEGCAAPVHLKAPEGSVVNCRFPAAVAARMQIGHFLTEIIYRAMAAALPDRVIAGSGGTPATMNAFYGKRYDGTPWQTVLIRGGGMGASRDRDGAYCYVFPANGANTPVEVFESDSQMIVERRELITDSGGPGKQRGGLGRRMVFRIPDDEYAPAGPVSLGLQAGRFRYPPEGLDGGRAGGRAAFLINGEPALPYGVTLLRAGDVVTMDAAGGGGFGDPREREPELVARDVREGQVSLERAREDYRVVVDPQTFAVDEAATKELRAEELRAEEVASGTVKSSV
jgi:N-methylhydantoinase B